MRTINLPSRLRIYDTNETLINNFGLIFEKWGNKAIIVCGKTAFSIIGNSLVECYRQYILHVEVINNNDYSSVQDLDQRLFMLTPRCIIAIGGGKVIDIGKLVAHRWRLPFISVPTQVSHDGIASPISVIEGVDSCTHSLGATIPVAVVTSLELVKNAPLITIKSGIGDILANLTALFDWELAASKGYDDLDDYAAIISKTAALTVLNELERHTDIHSNYFIRILIESLILSGIAMNIAGSSRPASGAEHLFSHAIDKLYGGITLHGIQVALGTILVADMQGQFELYQRLLTVYKRTGLPIEPIELNLKPKDLERIFIIAPETRPQRYTILNTLKESG